MILVDSELMVRAINPAAQRLLSRRLADVAGRLDCRTTLGCRPEAQEAMAGRPRRSACLCEQVLELHVSIANARLRIRPLGQREVMVSASCSPLPVDHLGGAAVVLRPLDGARDSVTPEELRAGPLRLNAARHTLSAHGRLLRLAPIDFELVQTMMLHPGQVVRRSDLLESVWHHRDISERDLLKSHIGMIRRRLRQAAVTDVHIENIHGVGYMLRWDGAEAPADIGDRRYPGAAGDWW
jgi:DNA-binding winged helix-turn-helix (wHTH) protein